MTSFYNIRKKNNPESVVHRAAPLDNNDDYCASLCGRFLSTDQYIVTTAPVTCARCLYVIKDKEIDNGLSV